MSSLNRIILLGSVANEPELKSTNAGDSLLKLRLKVDRPSREGTDGGHDYISITMWRDLADQFKTVSLNDVMLVEGSILTRTYDTEDGKRKWVTEVDAKEARLVSAPAFTGQDPLSQPAASFQPTQPATPQAEPSSTQPVASATDDGANIAQATAQAQQETVEPVVEVAESSLESLETAPEGQANSESFNFDDQQSEFSEEFSEEDIPF